MDYNTPNDFPRQDGPVPGAPPAGPIREKGSRLATASLVLGILSIVTLCCVYPPFILGGVGITLALLSRGNRRHMLPNAMTGMILSIIGSAITFIIVLIAVVFMFTNPEYRNMIDNYEQYYYDGGDDFDFDEGGPSDFLGPVFPGNSGDL